MDTKRVVVHDPTTDKDITISTAGDLVVTLDGENIVASFPAGSSSTGTIALASANTWYAVPASTPTKDYVIAVSKENAAGTIRYSIDDNGSTPSATFGNKMPTHIAFSMGADKKIYFGSSTSGDDVNYSYIEVEA